MSGIRDLWLGRLALPTAATPVTEQLGSEIANVGEATAVGQRRAKGFALTFPIHGTPGDMDLQQAGNSMRRRLRSLVQNTAYRVGGVYLWFGLDSERNGWLVIGEAELADDNGGVPFGEYTLTVSQAFLVGTRVTHREGLDLDITDLRAAATLDFYGQVPADPAAWPALAGLSLAFLPPGTLDPTVREAPLSLSARASGDGQLAIATASDADVIAFDRAEKDRNTADVRVIDRRGIQNVRTFGHSVAAGYYAEDWGGAYTDGGFGGLISTTLGFSARVAHALSAAEVNFAIGGSRASWPTYGPQPGGWAWALQHITPGSDLTRGVAPDLYVLMTGINDLADMPATALQPVREAIRTTIARMRARAVFEDDDPSIAYGSGWQSFPANPPNLIAAPLDSTSLTGWSALAGATLTSSTATPLYIGPRAGKIVTPGSTPGEGASYVLPGTLPSKPHTFSVWLRSTGPGVTMRIGIGDASAPAVTLDCALTASWQRFSVTWTPGSPTTGAKVYVFTPATGAVSVWVNAAQATQTPMAVPFSDTAISIGSGATLHIGSTPTTITVPDTFAGGQVDIGFTTVSTALAPTGQAVWDVSLDGTTDTYTIDASMVPAQSADGGGAIGTVHRLSGLAPGAHTIIVTLASQTGSLVSALDYWQAEQPVPPPVCAVQMYYALAYLIPGVNAPQIDLLNAAIVDALSMFPSRVVTCLPVIPPDPANFATDGLHPSGAGHALIASAVLDAVQALAPPAEEVYGPDYPWSWVTSSVAEDTPGISNGCCRLEFDSSRGIPGFWLYGWDPTLGGWVRAAQVLINRNGDAQANCDTLASSALLEYTPERAVIQVVLRVAADPHSRETVIVTLQRGWSGPRIEVYPAPKADGTPADAGVYLFEPLAPTVNDSALKVDATGAEVVSTAASGGGVWTFSPLGLPGLIQENWLTWIKEVAPIGGFTPSQGFQVTLAGVQFAYKAEPFVFSEGVLLNYMGLQSQGAQGYISAHVGLAPAIGQAFEAEDYVTGTASSVVDGAASAGHAASDAQGTAAAPSVTIPWAGGAVGSKVRIVVRAKVTGGVTGSVKAQIAGATTTSTATATTTASSYAWVDLGEVAMPADVTDLLLTGWQSAGGTIRLDRVEVYQVEDRSGAYLGARDIGEQALRDVRAQLRLIDRS